MAWVSDAQSRQLGIHKNFYACYHEALNGYFHTLMACGRLVYWISCDFYYKGAI